MGEAPKPPGPADYEPTRLLTGSLGGGGGYYSRVCVLLEPETRCCPTNKKNSTDTASSSQGSSACDTPFLTLWAWVTAAPRDGNLIQITTIIIKLRTAKKKERLWQNQHTPIIQLNNEKLKTCSHR